MQWKHFSFIIFKLSLVEMEYNKQLSNVVLCHFVECSLEAEERKENWQGADGDDDGNKHSVYYNFSSIIHFPLKAIIN